MASGRQPVSSVGLRMASAVPLFTFGFRPFFLLAGLGASVSLLLWLLALEGVLFLPSGLDPVLWHQHEMIFGFAVAAIAGFLLTAIPNWTGRLPVAGWPLATLTLLWLAGRVAIAFSGSIGPWAAAVIDGAFLPVFAAVILREIIGGRNWRNLKVAIPVLLLALCNLAVHAEQVGLVDGAARAGSLLAIFLVLTLIATIGGRIIPSFTRNWLAKRGAARLPRSDTRLDAVAVGVVPLLGVSFVLLPEHWLTAALALAGALVHGWRLVRWRGQDTGGEALVWILHAGYAWLPVGFLLLFFASIGDAFLLGSALHALTAGAIGTMILAVMTRASLGHSGRALTADPATVASYGLVLAAAALRVIAPAVGWPTVGYGVAGALWIGGFALFVIAYAPLLILPRRR